MRKKLAFYTLLDMDDLKINKCIKHIVKALI